MRSLIILVVLSLTYALGVSNWACDHCFISVPTFTTSHTVSTVSIRSDQSHLLDAVLLKEVTLTATGTILSKYKKSYISPLASIQFAPITSTAYFIGIVGGFILSIISQVGLSVLFQSLLF